MGRLRLELGAPQHGWMRVTLAQGEQRIELDASYTPVDSLSMLVGAGLDIATGCQEAKVVWSLEPAKSLWEFRREGARLQVRVTTDGSPPVHLAGGSPEDVALAIWRALRRLESDEAWTRPEVGRLWVHPFPHRAVAQLGAALRR